MESAMYVIIIALVVSAVGWILLPVFVQFINQAGLNNLSVSGSVVNYSWAATLSVVIYVLAIAILPVGVLIYTLKSMSHHKK